jgi:signal transduction histidine kinase
MPESLLEELKRYVGWGPEDERALRALHGLAAPRFPAIAEVFYAAILEHQDARKALAGGEQQVGRLKVTLQRWLDTLLRGPWDDDYFEARCRIGRVHVKIDLPQHYMFGGMNVVRQQLNQIIDEDYLSRPADLKPARMAVGRALDLELAIMLHTYREDLLAAQARQERLATYGQLVASIGHDLRNPLGVIETSLFILKGRAPPDDRVQKHLTRIGEQLQVANGIIGNLLDLVRERPLAREAVALADVVRGAADAVQRPGEVALEQLGLSDLPAVSGDPVQLRQVFVNLVQNAVQAAGAAGRVWVRGGREPGGVAIAVEDTGPGVDPGTRRRLFEPLITTRDGGTGLGLALVKRIVERHGGTVGYEDRSGGGARFTVRLPA